MLRRAFAIPWLAMVAVDAARADVPQLLIVFDLAGSEVAAAGAIAIPPDGAIHSGMLWLTVPATEQGEALPGPASIRGLSLSLTADASYFYTAITGPFSVDQEGSAEATLTDAMDAVVLSRPLFLDRGGTISCGGWLCWWFADTFPLEFVGIEAIPAAARLQVADLGSPGRATIRDTLAVTMNGGTAVFRIQGEESRRAVLPEPRGADAIAAGALALCLLERCRRRASRARVSSVRRASASGAHA